MIKISVMYPHRDGGRFDMEYYTKSHMLMVQGKLGAACKGIAVEQGLGGAAPGSPPAYTAFGHIYFDTVEAFQAAFAPHVEEFMSDVPNYTDLEPVVQVSEVKV